MVGLQDHRAHIYTVRVPVKQRLFDNQRLLDVIADHPQDRTRTPRHDEAGIELGSISSSQCVFASDTVGGIRNSSLVRVREVDGHAFGKSSWQGQGRQLVFNRWLENLPHAWTVSRQRTRRTAEN
jgi:hypothetical protein